jgi:ketosteroid isomerase-like protein
MLGAMSLENVEMVRSAHEAFNRGGPQAVLDYLDPEIEWHDVPDQPDATVRHGHEGFLRAFDVFLESFAEFTVEPEELRDLGDYVLVVGRTRGRGVDSGAEFTQDVVSLWALRGGKIVQTRFFGSRAEALEAAERHK